jgi:hypothetical protein
MEGGGERGIRPSKRRAHQFLSWLLRPLSLRSPCLQIYHSFSGKFVVIRQPPYGLMFIASDEAHTWHGRRNIGVARELLDHPDVHAGRREASANLRRSKDT